MAKLNITKTHAKIPTKISNPMMEEPIKKGRPSVDREASFIQVHNTTKCF
jgi:hypothetical protein